MPNIVSQIIEVCVFRMKGKRVEYLLLKRSDGDRLYPGIWQLVTGMIKENEGTVHAALRELEEETGLQPLKMWRLPSVNSFYEPVQDVIHVCPNFAVQVGEKADPVLSHEHQKFKWCLFGRAVELLPWSGQRRAVELVKNTIIRKGEEASLLKIHISH